MCSYIDRCPGECEQNARQPATENSDEHTEELFENAPSSIYREFDLEM